jgi:hypothetical protein
MGKGWGGWVRDIIAGADWVPVVGVVAYLVIASCDLREAVAARRAGRRCGAAVVKGVAYVVLGVKLLM